jgi:lambda repressor-like predicted transcriptional regulator
MHWADIIAAIQKSQSSLTAIAEQEGVSQATVSQVIHGHRTSHPIAYAIAAVTGIPTEQMWPGRYLTAPAYKRARGNYDRGRLPLAANA